MHQHVSRQQNYFYMATLHFQQNHFQLNEFPIASTYFIRLGTLKTDESAENTINPHKKRKIKEYNNPLLICNIL